MTEEEFSGYLASFNRSGAPFPIVSCSRCLTPIVEHGVVLAEFRPPQWYHLECVPRELYDAVAYEVARGWYARSDP